MSLKPSSSAAVESLRLLGGTIAIVGGGVEVGVCKIV